jgi:hypothetical protein
MWLPEDRRVTQLEAFYNPYFESDTEISRTANEIAGHLARGKFSLDASRWRWHGLGALQCEISEALRIHVWHPKLRVIPEDDLRAVHDHRFNLVSHVIVGRIKDTPYSVVSANLDTSRNRSRVMGAGKGHAFRIVHAKNQATHDGAVSEHLGPVCWFEHQASTWGPEYDERSRSYAIRRRQFHATSVDALAITLIHRSDFDDEPARVLGPTADPPSSGIVHDAPEHAQVMREVLAEAADLLNQKVK